MTHLAANQTARTLTTHCGERRTGSSADRHRHVVAGGLHHWPEVVASGRPVCPRCVAAFEAGSRRDEVAS